jgi:hypothetical protein
MLELCMSGKAWRIFLRSSLAHTMKAFMGLLMWLLFRDSGKWREPRGQGQSQPDSWSETGRAISPM